MKLLNVALVFLWRQALYCNNLHTAWWHDLNQPEDFGFKTGQVTPFSISSAENVELYTWHIQPDGPTYKKEAVNLTSGLIPSSKFEDTDAFHNLKSPSTHLIINFHGNAGHVAQNHRTPSYKSFLSHNEQNVHILTLDYRGFGLSTGTPDEEGLIEDGVALVNWAMEVAQIPANRVVIVGHSLGTAIATAVADHFVSQDKQIEFLGLVLVAPFSTIPNLVLDPIAFIPGLRRFIEERLVDDWNTMARLKHLASQSKSLRLHIFHARNDWKIPFRHSDVLLEAAIEGANSSASSSQIHEVLEESTRVRTWSTTKGKAIHITQSLLKNGSHSKIIANPPVALAIREIFTKA